MFFSTVFGTLIFSAVAVFICLVLATLVLLYMIFQYVKYLDGEGHRASWKFAEFLGIAKETSNKNIAFKATVEWDTVIAKLITPKKEDDQLSLGDALKQVKLVRNYADSTTQDLKYQTDHQLMEKNGYTDSILKIEVRYLTNFADEWQPKFERRLTPTNTNVKLSLSESDLSDFTIDRLTLISSVNSLIKELKNI